MFKRAIESELLSLAKGYPVITIVGPRQSGKTTLAKRCFPKKPYVNLEEPDTRNLAEFDPRGFLEKFPKGAILDEIQRLPILLSYIQSIVDQKQQSGLFILTGSHQLELSQSITQTLAGRTALLTLLPMSLAELQESDIDLSWEEAILKGGYPRIFKDHLNPTVAYRNYFQTYVERDLRSMINVKDLSLFQKFVQLAASRIGQLLNAESLGNDVGVSGQTIKQWISLLEASFVVMRLQPYHENFGKRALKSPKLYFTDVGLVAYLLGIENVEQIERDPLRGNLFENLVFLELVKARLNQGLDPNLYFFRDSGGHEVDFLYKKGHELIPIEAKSTKSFQPALTKGIAYFSKLAGERTLPGWLVYAGDEEMKGKIGVCNFKNCAQIVKS